MIVVFNGVPIERGAFSVVSVVIGRASTAAAETTNEIIWLVT